MAKHCLQVAFALLLALLLPGLRAQALPDACTSAQPKRTVCNLGWPNKCRQVDVNQRPVCRAAADFIAKTKVSTTVNAALVDAISSPISTANFKTKFVDIVIALPGLEGVIKPFTIKVPVPDLDAMQKDAADGILVTLDADPFNAEAQGKARGIIRSCAPSASTPAAMFACSGFMVTPIVRLQCLGNGACLPTPWGPKGVANGFGEWAAQVAYDKADAGDLQAAFVRPWVASEATIKKCKSVAKNGDAAGKNARFTLCMTEHMGGDSTRLAVACYGKYPRSPLEFAGCINKVKLDKIAVGQADCAVRGDTSLECLRRYGLPSDKVNICENTNHTDKDQLRVCLAKLPRVISPVTSCATTFKGDISAIGHCLAGANLIKSKKVLAAQICGTGAFAGADKPAGQAQRDMLSCLAKSQPDVVKVAKAAEKAAVAANCLQDPSEDLSKKAQCLRDAGVKFPKEVELAECVSKAKNAAEAAACTGVNGAAQLAAVQRCLSEAGTDNTRRTLCIGSQVGLPTDQAKILECAATSEGAGDGLICMAGSKLPPAVAQAASCAVKSQGSPAGTALCMAGPNMNAELRIAAECIASTGGEPISFAGCAGGRLTMKELQQCIAGDFKPENGCFGENNEVVKFYKAQEEVLRGVLKAAGLEQAYDKMLNDLKSGKLGENNEIRRIGSLVNDLATRPPAETVSRAIDEARHAGKTIQEGTGKLAEEVGKVGEKLKTEVENALPKLPPPPSVNVKTDLPGGGAGSVTVGPGGGSVSVGNSGVSVNPGEGSINVTVGGSCLGIGC